MFFFLSAVFLLCLYDNMVDIVMKTAEALGMLKGDFVFLSLEAELTNHVATNTNTGGNGDHASHRRRREAEPEQLYQSRVKRDMTSSSMNMSDGMAPMNMSHDTSPVDTSHDMTTGHTSADMMSTNSSHLTG